jgi:hypothetical protein
MWTRAFPSTTRSGVSRATRAGVDAVPSISGRSGRDEIGRKPRDDAVATQALPDLSGDLPLSTIQEKFRR